MTLQEAIKSGKPFRRKSQINMSFFYKVETDDDCRIVAYYPDQPRGWFLELSDIMTDDWEIQQGPREYWGFVVGDHLVGVTSHLDDLMCATTNKTNIIKVREVIEPTVTPKEYYVARSPHFPHDFYAFEYLVEAISWKDASVDRKGIKFIKVQAVEEVS